MLKITEYKIITAILFAELEHKTNEAIQEGWQPLGNMQFCEDKKPPYVYFRELVKYAEQVVSLSLPQRIDAHLKKIEEDVNACQHVWIAKRGSSGNILKSCKKCGVYNVENN